MEHVCLDVSETSPMNKLSSEVSWSGLSKQKLFPRNQHHVKINSKVVCFVIFIQGSNTTLRNWRLNTGRCDCSTIAVVLRNNVSVAEKIQIIRFPQMFSFFMWHVYYHRLFVCCSCNSLKMSHVSEAIIHLLRIIGQGHHHNNQLTAITMSLKLLLLFHNIFCFNKFLDCSIF